MSNAGESIKFDGNEQGNFKKEFGDGDDEMATIKKKRHNPDTEAGCSSWLKGFETKTDLSNPDKTNVSLKLSETPVVPKFSPVVPNAKPWSGRVLVKPLKPKLSPVRVERSLAAKLKYSEAPHIGIYEDPKFQNSALKPEPFNINTPMNFYVENENLNTADDNNISQLKRAENPQFFDAGSLPTIKSIKEHLASLKYSTALKPEPFNIRTPMNFYVENEKLNNADNNNTTQLKSTENPKFVKAELPTDHLNELKPLSLKNDSICQPAVPQPLLPSNMNAQNSEIVNNESKDGVTPLLLKFDKEPGINNASEDMGNNFVCNFYNYTTIIETYLDRMHTILHPFSCMFCSFKCLDPTAFKNHLNSHSTQNSFICGLCKMGFLQLCELEQHLKDHKHNILKCAVCNYKSAGASNMTSHMMQHLELKTFTCSVCNEQFFDETMFETHEKIHIPPQHCCSFCDFKCENAFTFTYHVQCSHSAQLKQLVCDDCGYKWLHLTSFEKHLRSHLGTPHFNCDFCDYKTFKKHLLNSHIKRHYRDRSFSCVVCGYKTDTLKNINMHIKKHTNDDKWFDCELGRFKTTNETFLEKHMRRHILGKRLFCEVCDFKCMNESTLKQHMRTAHIKKAENTKLETVNNNDDSCPKKNKRRKIVKNVIDNSSSNIDSINKFDNSLSSIDLKVKDDDDDDDVIFVTEIVSDDVSSDRKPTKNLKNHVIDANKSCIKKKLNDVARNLNDLNYTETIIIDSDEMVDNLRNHFNDIEEKLHDVDKNLNDLRIISDVTENCKNVEKPGNDHDESAEKMFDIALETMKRTNPSETIFDKNVTKIHASNSEKNGNSIKETEGSYYISDEIAKIIDEIAIVLVEDEKEMNNNVNSDERNMICVAKNVNDKNLRNFEENVRNDEESMRTDVKNEKILRNVEINVNGEKTVEEYLKNDGVIISTTNNGDKLIGARKYFHKITDNGETNAETNLDKNAINDSRIISKIDYRTIETDSNKTSINSPRIIMKMDLDKFRMTDAIGAVMNKEKNADAQIALEDSNRAIVRESKGRLAISELENAFEANLNKIRINNVESDLEDLKISGISESENKLPEESMLETYFDNLANENVRRIDEPQKKGIIKPLIVNLKKFRGKSLEKDFGKTVVKNPTKTNKAVKKNLNRVFKTYFRGISTLKNPTKTSKPARNHLDRVLATTFDKSKITNSIKTNKITKDNLDRALATALGEPKITNLTKMDKPPKTNVIKADKSTKNSLDRALVTASGKPTKTNLTKTDKSAKNEPDRAFSTSFGKTTLTNVVKSDKPSKINLDQTLMTDSDESAMKNRDFDKPRIKDTGIVVKIDLSRISIQDIERVAKISTDKIAINDAGNNFKRTAKRKKHHVGITARHFENKTEKNVEITKSYENENLKKFSEKTAIDYIFKTAKLKAKKLVKSQKPAELSTDTTRLETPWWYVEGGPSNCEDSSTWDYLEGKAICDDVYEGDKEYSFGGDREYSFEGNEALEQEQGAGRNPHSADSGEFRKLNAGITLHTNEGEMTMEYTGETEVIYPCKKTTWKYAGISAVGSAMNYREETAWLGPALKKYDKVPSENHTTTKSYTDFTFVTDSGETATECAGKNIKTYKDSKKYPNESVPKQNEDRTASFYCTLPYKTTVPTAIKIVRKETNNTSKWKITFY